jgi:hypothetical protein
LTVFSLVLHTNDLTRNGGLFVSSFLERFLDRSVCGGLRGQSLTYDFSVIMIRCHDLLALSFPMWYIASWRVEIDGRDFPG